MTTTEAVPCRRRWPNRVADVYESLEQGKPLAVRLDKDNTAGPSQFSGDPRSTWGFNPYKLLRKPTDDNFHTASPCSHLVVRLIENKCLDILKALDDVSEPVCSKIHWYQLPQASRMSTLDSDRSDITGLCIYSDLVGMINHLTGRCIVGAAQLTRQVGTACARSTAVKPSKPLEVNLSDYFDPLSLEWDESDYKAAEAARNFSEELYADH